MKGTKEDLQNAFENKYDAVIVQLIASGDIKEAIRFATIAGAITVTRMGAQPSLPTVEDVVRFEARIKNY